MPSKFPLYEKGVNTSEFMDNRELTQSLTLLKDILEGLNPENFTLEEIQHEFNAGTKIQTPLVTRVRFGPSHIESLIDNGLIEEASEQGHYCVTEEGREWYEKEDSDEETQKGKNPKE